MQAFKPSIYELIVQTSTNLPSDVRRAMDTALDRESSGNQASQALAVIANDIDMAADAEGAICQDTGWPTFEVKTPISANQLAMKKEIVQAIADATAKGKLRPNSVDSEPSVPVTCESWSIWLAR